MGLVLFCYSYDYYKVSSEIGYGVNILGLFVSVYGGATGFPRIMTLFGSVLLFCDAPFMDENQQFVYLRLGRKKWVTGTLIYVFVTSFIYTLYLILALALGVLPNMGISAEWGELFEVTSINSGVTKAGITQKVLMDYSVLTGFLYMFAAVFLSCVVIGLVMYIVALFAKKGECILVGCGIIIIEGVGLYFTENISNILFHISPLSLMQIWCLDDGSGNSYYPDMNFGIVFYIVVTIVLLLIGMTVSKFANFEIGTDK
ncbi:MAG: hypothetical protein II374_03085 [Lachnospiraceae bacterium]|nr:hypothetical protein [Lachnospiraceae bacterium]MBQ2320307.1 hypothetical protein [Lachnospiraceae bacterium]